MGTRVRVILNAKSGRGGADAAQLIAKFAAHGCACAVTELGPGVDLAGLVASEPLEVALIAAGGDGTVNAVANAVAGTARRMGVLPIGTLNHFAKDLGLPEDLDEAIAVAAGESTRQVDAAEVNGHVFVNNSSLGAYPLMVLDRERLKKTGWNKWTSLAIASAKAFAVLWRMRVEVEVDGVELACRTPFVFIGNNEYCLNGLQLGARKRIDQGHLAVYLARGAGRWSVLKLGLAALLGRVDKVQEYEEMKGSTVTLHLRRRRPRVALDGEVKRIAGPLSYRTRPGALTVLCGERTQD